MSIYDEWFGTEEERFRDEVKEATRTARSMDELIRQVQQGLKEMEKEARGEFNITPYLDEDYIREYAENEFGVDA